LKIKVAFPSDEHHPYQDDKAIDVALKIVEDFKPDEIVVGSDGVDFYSISKFSKDPARMKGRQLQDEINSWKATQRKWIDAAPDAKRHYITGNHEDRLEKYIWDHPELHGLDALLLHSLLGFDELGLDEVEDEIVYGNKLVIKHGTVVRKHSAYTARGELEGEMYAISTLTGHTHRGGTHMATSRFGMVQAVEGFCLCDLNPPYIKGKPNWQQGIVLATVSDFGVHFEPIPFFKKRGKTLALWRGKQHG
jgi:predicted phosphodiesterase